MTADRCRLYLITPEIIQPRLFANYLASALDAGDVACVQLRLKTASKKELIMALDIIRPLVQSRNVACLLNDDASLAAETGCDGVHVGQHDIPYREARAIVGDQAIVGVTCLDSIDLAMRVAQEGADYVAFGSFFPSKTKKSEGHPTPIILENWKHLATVPSVAIGGINSENCSTLVSAGADFLAVVSAVWEHPLGPAKAVKELNNAIHQSGK